MVTILACSDHPTADALAIAIAQQRSHILVLEQIVSAARDAVARAGAELDAAVRERDRAVFHLLQLHEQLDDRAVQVP